MLIVTVNLVLDAKPEEAADAVNEILRQHLREQQADPERSCLMDYAVQAHAVPVKIPGRYEEGDAFVGI